ncbi:MAG: helix-turn-helix domain-containing protein [bacterium]
MAKRQFRLTDEQVQELVTAYDACKDGPTRTRYQAVRLYGIGYPAQEIIDITGCSYSSLMGWCRAYRKDGVEALVDKRVGGNRAKLTSAEIEDLSKRLRLYTPTDLFGPTAATADGQFWTVPDLKRAVRQWYGVSYQSNTSCYRLLDPCGFSYQRPARAYKSRSAAKIAEFEEQREKNCSTSPRTLPRP